MFAAENILHDGNYVPPRSPGKVTGLRWWFGFLFDWAMFFQFSTTLLLTLVIGIVAWLTGAK